jgi:hypothetical protein
MSEAYQPQPWQERLDPEHEAAMRARGRRYRPPQSELDDPYVLDHSFIAIERQRRLERLDQVATEKTAASGDDINRLAP